MWSILSIRFPAYFRDSTGGSEWTGQLLLTDYMSRIWGRSKTVIMIIDTFTDAYGLMPSLVAKGFREFCLNSIFQTYVLLATRKTVYFPNTGLGHLDSYPHMHLPGGSEMVLNLGHQPRSRGRPQSSGTWLSQLRSVLAGIRQA